MDKKTLLAWIASQKKLVSGMPHATVDTDGKVSNELVPFAWKNAVEFTLNSLELFVNGVEED